MTALHSCLSCSRHPSTHAPASADDACPMCGLGENETEQLPLDGCASVCRMSLMNSATILTIRTAAVARATSLCDAALADLAQGRKTFVKGKPVFVPFSEEARRQRRFLQRDAFDGAAAETAVAKILGGTFECSEDEERTILEAYRTAGQTEVERRFA